MERTARHDPRLVPKQQLKVVAKLNAGPQLIGLVPVEFGQKLDQTKEATQLAAKYRIV